MTRPFKATLASLGMALLALPAYAAAPLVVHEWGTFTTVQDPGGNTLYGVYINNEPVPDFVHRIKGAVVDDPDGEKGSIQQHPNVCMRLETPVLYFYPNSDQKLPLSVDVHVGMKGGWLTEFYPEAEANITMDDVRFEKPLKKDFVGTLSWKNLQVGGKGVGPVTTAPVWTTPRNVASAMIDAPSGESENYLFYRGLANLESPLKVIRAGHDLLLTASKDFTPSGVYGEIGSLWYVDIKAGKVAFRTVPRLSQSGGDGMAAREKHAFADEDYSKENLGILKSQMQAALVEDGLFADEAAAMLSTWKHSYFQTEGTRVFFILPRKWTDHYLPLQISVPAKIERAMIGRVEMTSQELQTQ